MTIGSAGPVGVAGRGPSGGSMFGPPAAEACPLTAAQVAEQDQILAGYLAAVGDDLVVPEEGEACWVDPDSGPPMGADFWLGQLPSPCLRKSWPGGPPRRARSRGRRSRSR